MDFRGDRLQRAKAEARAIDGERNTQEQACLSEPLDDDATIRDIQRELCRLWNWNFTGMRAHVLDFLLYDGFLTDDENVVIEDRAKTARTLIEEVVVEDVITLSQPAEPVAAAVVEIWNRWPRRGPPPIPVRRQRVTDVHIPTVMVRARGEFKGTRVGAPPIVGVTGAP